MDGRQAAGLSRWERGIAPIDVTSGGSTLITLTSVRPYLELFVPTNRPLTVSNLSGSIDEKRQS